MKDKDQEEFKRHCMDALANFDYVYKKALDAYHLAHDAEEVLFRKHNAGLRAGNLVFLDALRQVQCTKWRTPKGEKRVKPVPKSTPRAPLTDIERNAIAGNPKGKYKGPSILEMAGLT